MVHEPSKETNDLTQLTGMLELVYYPMVALSKSTEEVEDLNAEAIRPLIIRMVEVMKRLEGVGIAANQLGVPERICICWLNDRQPDDIQVMINPRIIRRSNKMVSDSEGCLSFPYVEGVIRRSEWIYVEWTDMEGFMDWERFDGFNARIVQHELDHLDGIGIIDKFNVADKAKNRKAIEDLEISVGILPNRMRKKGYVLRRK